MVERDPDVPLGGLPPADTALLGSAPLEVALIEVRFSGGRTITTDEAVEIRNRLNSATKTDYASIQPTQQQTVQIEFGPSGSNLGQTSGVSGWQIATQDNSRLVGLMPDSAVLQTNRYSRWSESLAAPLAVTLEAIAEFSAPTLSTRVGLRYVDRFRSRDATSPAHWIGRIDSTVLGSLTNPTFGPMVRGSLQQLDLELDSEHRAIVRHGLTQEEEERVGYVLDIDVFKQFTSPFDLTDLSQTAQQLNRTALSLFQACVEPGYLASLRPTVPAAAAREGAA